MCVCRVCKCVCVCACLEKLSAQVMQQQQIFPLSAPDTHKLPLCSNCFTFGQVLYLPPSLALSLSSSLCLPLWANYLSRFTCARQYAEHALFFPVIKTAVKTPRHVLRQVWSFLSDFPLELQLFKLQHCGSLLIVSSLLALLCSLLVLLSTSSAAFNFLMFHFPVELI